MTSLTENTVQIFVPNGEIDGVWCTGTFNTAGNEITLETSFTPTGEDLIVQTGQTAPYTRAKVPMELQHHKNGRCTITLELQN